MRLRAKPQQHRIARLNVVAVPTAICVGASSTLTATTNVIGAGNVTLGAGASTSSSSGSSMFPGTYGGAKTQFIVKASELTNAGLVAVEEQPAALVPVTV